MASVGHSLIGDTMYGEKSELIDRQALHAYQLSFPSPLSGERITVEAPLPSDMCLLLDELSIEKEI